MISPDGPLIGERFTDISTGLPSLRMRTVSKFSIRSPRAIRRK
jgi:hypothetical protein